MKTFPTLWKKNKAGKWQYWTMRIRASESHRYYTLYGTEGGKETKSKDVVCIGKQGRTHSQQAESEALSIWTKKKDTGYAETKEDAEDGDSKMCGAGLPEPMLAFEWDKETVESGSFVQPKLDGVRCLATAKGLFSRNGKPFRCLQHLESALAPVFKKFPTLILDGELYNHNLRNDFNSIVSAVKKKSATEDELEHISKVVQYHCYDFTDLAGNKASHVFQHRASFIEEEIATRVADDSVFVAVETVGCNSRKSVKAYHDKCVAQGYEGCMLRTNTPYQNGRTTALVKVKEMMEEEFEIIGMEEGRGKAAGLAAKLVCWTPKGVECRPTCTGSASYRVALWKGQRKYIGKKATIIFQNYTPDGAPRFPRVKAIDRKAVEG